MRALVAVDVATIAAVGGVVHAPSCRPSRQQPTLRGGACPFLPGAYRAGCEPREGGLMGLAGRSHDRKWARVVECPLFALFERHGTTLERMSTCESVKLDFLTTAPHRTHLQDDRVVLYLRNASVKFIRNRTHDGYYVLEHLEHEIGRVQR